MAGEDNLRLEGLGSANRVIEVVDLEPQQDTVAVRPIIGIADWSVVVCDLEAVQLEYQYTVRDQPLVVRPAVRTVTAEEVLIPTTARFHIGGGYQRLGTHSNLHGQTL